MKAWKEEGWLKIISNCFKSCYSCCIIFFDVANAKWLSSKLILFVRNYYGCEIAGFSIPAAEHRYLSLKKHIAKIECNLLQVICKRKWRSRWLFRKKKKKFYSTRQKQECLKCKKRRSKKDNIYYICNKKALIFRNNDR